MTPDTPNPFELEPEDEREAFVPDPGEVGGGTTAGASTADVDDRTVGERSGRKGKAHPAMLDETWNGSVPLDAVEETAPEAVTPENRGSYA